MFKITKKNFFHLSLICTLYISACSDSKDHKTSETGTEDIVQAKDYDSLGLYTDVFDLTEITVSTSPASAQSWNLRDGESVVDYDVSPAGPVVAALVKSSSGHAIKFWNIAQAKISDSCLISGYIVSAIAWHPRANSLFVLGEKDKQSHILRIEKGKEGWTANNIFSSPNRLRRLVFCPRPFVVDGDHTGKVSKYYFSYRIFFGMSYGENQYRTVSVTETGKRLYQVIGPKATISHFEDADLPASTMEAEWSLPIGFHPGGHKLIWEDIKHDFFAASYERRFWGDYKPLTKNISREGTITPTPNGLGFLHWQKNKMGIGVYLLPSNRKELQLPEYQFTSTPSSVPDGKGIVGLTQKDGKQVLNYLPIDVPLADVTNAWMYVESSEEMDLLKKNYGLFRPGTGDQLYQLYDSESYYCDGYDPNSPTRPYMVTTDILWELFGAAYEGIFIVKEKDRSIPVFWNFVAAANEYYKKTAEKSKWAPAFAALQEFNSGKLQSLEAKNIQKAEGTMRSEVLQDDFEYATLKPRGHYTSAKEMENYFKAFKYFTTVFAKEPEIMQELNSLPAEIKRQIAQWIESYMGFISPPRSPMVLKELKYDYPTYCQYPAKENRIFPLSWGFDNEVLFSTVYHENFPPEKQITGPGGVRDLPSGLDIAAALGNNFAETLLESEYKKYPPLKNVMADLKANFQKNGKAGKKNENLYDQWMTALAVQWTDSVSSPCSGIDKNIWDVKRLQTGLASWATLRHATALVNETGAAECGEAGFEEMLMRAPRGYVEPDPYTFSQIAALFELTEKYVSKDLAKNNHGSAENRSLYEGIITRLKEAASEARQFQTIAEKEIRGEELTNEEYEKILYTGRVAEHYFLIFKSLVNASQGLADPDPMAKIAEVFGGGEFPYLMAAVGNPLEWDHVVPFYGRKQIVKGSVYSYYEFSSEKLFNDNEWQEQIKSKTHLPWVKPYITEKGVSHPAITGY